MHVVGVAIVGETDGHDRFQGGRPARGDLQRIEAAPGFADDRDAAVAPRLTRDPGDRLQRIVLLEFEVFVVEQAVGIAGAAHVDANGGEAGGGEIGMHRLVTPTRRVAFAVRDIFDNGGRRPGGRFGKPQSRREPRSVFQLDEDIFDDLDRAHLLFDPQTPASRRAASQIAAKLAAARFDIARARRNPWTSCGSFRHRASTPEAVSLAA